MTATQFISKQLKNTDSMKIESVDTICAFSGRKIEKGIALKNVLSPNFTDNAYVRYQSDYCSIDVAQCMQPISSGNRASLRNYSFLATENKLTLLSREFLFETVVNKKPIPFVLVVTYNAKKHVSYKTKMQFSNTEFTVFTDSGDVKIRQEALNTVLPIVQNWYSVVKGKESTSTLPTYFTKNEILTGQVSNAKITAYGAERFFEENQILENYYNSPSLKLIVFIIKKQINA
jgi:hypothetical protein